MKTIFTLALLFISISQVYSQNFAWVQGFGSDIWDYSSSSATDPDGNVLVTGYFRNTMDADPGPAVVNLVSAGETDIYVSKFNASGTLLWARQMSGPLNESAKGIATDSDGNIYITGVYAGAVDFDPGPGVSNLYTSQSSKTFICKLNSAGQLVWVKGFEGSSMPYAIAVDGNHHVYTTGRFSSVTDFDTGAGIFTMDAHHYPDMFVCKMNQNGELVWARQIAENGDTATITVKSVVVDNQGNVITTGIFNGEVDFDPGTGVFNLLSAGEQTDVSFPRNAFVSKLDADGNFVWAGSIGQDAEIEATDIASDEDGNMYAIGYFLETTDFDPGPATFNMTSNSTGANSYIVKLAPDGQFAWAKAFSGPNAALARGIVVSEDAIYTAGYFNGFIDFDPGPVVSYLGTFGGSDVFVSKLDLDGNYIWAQKAGGLSDEVAISMAFDPSTGNIFVSGYFTDTTDFDPSLENWELASHGEWDVFLLKLGTCVPNNGITEVVETCNQYVWSETGGLYTSSGVYWNTLTSASGCDSTVKLDLTLWNYESSISMNSSGYLVAQNNAFIDEYKWINCQTFEVVGTQGSFHVTVGGSYALISTSGDCVDTTACIHVTVAGLSELESAGFSIYPNPVSDQLTFYSMNASQPFDVEVSAVNGQLVYAGKHQSGDKLAVENWQSGIYLVKVISGEDCFVTRVVRE